MTLCEACEGAGYQLFMLNGKTRFARCCVCDGERTIIFMLGAQPFPPLTKDICIRTRR